MMRDYKYMFFALLSAMYLLMVIHNPARAQITSAVPQVQAVYGGTVGVIASVPVIGEANKSRLFVTTDSANSVFYADIDHSLANPYASTNYALRVVPDMDGNANHGTPSWLDVHPASMRMFAACDDGLFSCTIASNSVATNITDDMNFVLIESNTLFAIGRAALSENNSLYYGTLDANGMLTQVDSLGSTNFRRNVKAAVNPSNRKLYVFEASTMTNLALYKSDSDYDAFSAATTFSSVSMPSGLGWSVEDINIAFGPDGRMFLGNGACGGVTNLQVAFSTNDGGSWATADTGSGAAGMAILNICCNGSGSDYKVYYGACVSSNRGESGTWAHMPTRSKVPPFSQVDAGWVEADPLNSQVIYFPTDKGLGASTNLGTDCFELNQGLTAVQINDMDFSASKDIAWLASQAGIRRATNFLTSPVWSDGEFNDPGVRCVAMDQSDASGLTAYTGSGARIYKTTTGGGTNTGDWTLILDLESSSLHGSWQTVKTDDNNVYAGYYGSTVYGTLGRFYISSGNGSNWTAVATNIDVNDIVIKTEDNARVAYIAVGKRTTSGTTADGGVYRYVSGSALTRVLTNAVDIRDLAVDSSGGIYASGAERNSDPGADPNFYHLVVFYMSPTSLNWSALTNTGLTNNLQNITSPEYGPVITVGKDSSSNDVPILAAVRTLYYFPQGGTNWISLYTYPNGTQIKMLYWDELLVGTTIGLYGQTIGGRSESTQTVFSVTGDIDGDHLADLVTVTNTSWYVWFSTAQYLVRGGPYVFNIAGTPVTGDIDGDRLADIISVSGTSWYVWFSTAQYLVRGGPYVFNIAGTPVTGDIDGDGLADIISVTGTSWYVWFSTAQYLVRGGPYTFDVVGTPVTGDIDGDRLADIISVTGTSWYVWFSTAQYLVRGGPYDLGISGTPATGDIDGDGLADLIEVVGSNWYVWFSTAYYLVRGGPYTMTLP